MENIRCTYRTRKGQQCEKDATYVSYGTPRCTQHTHTAERIEANRLEK